MPTPQTPNPIVQTTAAQDRAGSNKTIYDVSLTEVFARNLVAGMGRAAGSIMLYFIFIFVIGFWFAQVIWPRLQPFLNSYTQLVDSVENIQQVVPSNSGGGINQPEIQELIDYYSGSY